MIEDFDRCYAAVSSRDPRFDGWFYTGVTSTGIYCRPSCPAVTPKPANVRFFSTSAGAQAAGFRACLRCRPDVSPGSPEWDVRADLVGRAMRLIREGVVDREGVPGLARRLGYSSRHVHRQLVTELGVGPLALARAQRANTARTLIEGTSMSFTDVAFASGFASVRQFNDSIKALFARSPTQLRKHRPRSPTLGLEGLELRLSHRDPADFRSVFDHLAARTTTGLEEIEDGCYRRSLRLPHGDGIVEVSPGNGHLTARFVLDDLRDLQSAVQRCRRLFDLDADPLAVDEHLGADPVLAPMVDSRPGLRVTGSVDPFETAVRAILGQQVRVAAGRRLMEAFVEIAGTPLRTPLGGVTRRFPDADALADADLSRLRVPRVRVRALTALVDAVRTGVVDLEPGTDRRAVRSVLIDLPGLGPWTAEYIALRGLGDPDAFPTTDAALRRVAGRLGLPTTASALNARAADWSPWRAYAAQHLWSVT